MTCNHDNRHNHYAPEGDVQRVEVLQVVPVIIAAITAPVALWLDGYDLVFRFGVVGCGEGGHMRRATFDLVALAV